VIISETETNAGTTDATGGRADFAPRAAASCAAHDIGSFLDLATVRVDGSVLPGETRRVKVKHGA